MAIEVYFGINCWMDLVLLWASGRIGARAASGKRLIGAALAGALIASLATGRPAAFLNAWWAKLAAVPFMLLIAFGRSTPRLLFRRSLMFIALSALCAGLAAALLWAGYDGYWGSLAASLALVTCALHHARRPIAAFLVDFRVNGMHFRGLLDTGNALREPLSGSPCILGSEALFALGDRLCARQVLIQTAVGAAVRTVYALRDLELDYGGETLRIPMTWVCLSPRPLENGLDAVLPPWPYMEGSYEYKMDRQSA